MCLVWLGASCTSATKRAEKLAAAPSPLQEFAQGATLERVWSRGIGPAQDTYGHLRMAKVGSALYVANTRGQVFALDAGSGSVLWQQTLSAVRAGRTLLSGGVGVSEDLVLVGDERGMLYALSRNTGALKWSTQLSAPIRAPATMDNHIVVARTDDGRIHGRAAVDGRELWSYAGILPLLTLRGYSAPLIVGNTVIVGMDDGRIISIALETGDELWRYRLARPEGESVIERLVDVDGDLLLRGEVLYAVSYQGIIAALNWRSGSLLWNDTASSYYGLASGLGHVYMVDDQGVVHAYDERTGRQRWTQDDMARRELGAPAVISNYVVVGDRFGYCHLINQLDGRLVARVRHNKRGVRAAAIAEDNTIYLLGNGGKVAAYRVRSL